jgi:transitional endoplasmic reticulum ATPase
MSFENSKLDDLYLQQSIDIFKLEEIPIFNNMIVSNFIFEFPVSFKVLNVEHSGKFFKIDENTEIEIIKPDDIQPESSSNLPEEWISSVKQEFPGFQKIDEIINLINVSKKELKGKTNALIIHGISGVGKSRLVDLITKYSNWKTIKFDATDVYQSQFGDSEKYLKEIFKNAQGYENCFIVIDHLEVIASNKESKLEKLVLSELCFCLDDLSKLSNSFVFVIGITNEINSIDLNLRKIERFEREFEITVPKPENRKEIIKYLLKGSGMENSDSLIHFLCDKTQGFVASDLVKLIRNSLFQSIKQNKELDFNCFEESLKTVKSSIMDHKQYNFETNFSNLFGIDEIKNKIKVNQDS